MILEGTVVPVAIKSIVVWIHAVAAVVVCGSAHLKLHWGVIGGIADRDDSGREPWIGRFGNAIVVAGIGQLQLALGVRTCKWRAS